jgi:hypothetical protein
MCCVRLRLCVLEMPQVIAEYIVPYRFDQEKHCQKQQHS